VCFKPSEVCSHRCLARSCLRPLRAVRRARLAMWAWGLGCTYDPRFLRSELRVAIALFFF
jgi:hypothetical protein